MNDFCLTTDAVYLKNDIDILVQEIDTLFDTIKGEVLGDIFRGNDFDTFLWSTNVGTASIERYVLDLIRNKCDCFDFEITAHCTAYLGTQNDIILIEIGIENDEYEAKRIYKVE